MSFCDFAVNVEDAIDQGLEYDYQEPKDEEAPPQILLWLSDIPLFKSANSLIAQSSTTDVNSDEDNSADSLYFRRYRDREDRGLMGGMAMGGGATEFDGLEEHGSFDVDTTRGCYQYPYCGGGSNCGECRTVFMDQTTVETMREIVQSEQVGRVLEQTPDWYEKYSSFLSNKNPDYVIKTLSEMLENDDRIDFNISGASYQIRGELYLQEKALQFHINVFKDIFDGEYLVEFQRQRGCPHDFQAFYRQCQAKLGTIKDFLVVPVTSPSTGIFNFTKDIDGVALASVGFDMEKVGEYMNGVTAALKNCSVRFSSTLVDVRNEALRSLVLATEAFKPVVYNDIECVLEVLSIAAGKLTHVRGLNKEMGRCIAAIASNLCCNKAKELITEEDKKRLVDLRKGVHEKLVPILIAFWDKPSTHKCDARKRETDKQIVRLFDILYNEENGPTAYGEVTQKQLEKIESRMKSMDDSSQYKKMRIVLEKIVEVVKSTAKIVEDEEKKTDK
jgi:hypothetical protein